MSLKKALEAVRKHKNFIITSHTNVEGDALGSELAFYKLLKKLGKGATVINQDKVPYGYEFLPQRLKIKKFSGSMKLPDFDCFAVLDCSDFQRTGVVHKLNKARKPALNIDHHISNIYFGDINWVDPKASSCSEMIYRLYKELRVPFDKESAMLLYIGMLTDTGSFRYPNTTSFTHQAVSELLKFGLDVTEIHKYVYGNIPCQDMKLLIKILPRLKFASGGKIAWMQIESAVLRNKKLYFDLNERVLSFARAIKGVEVAVLFRENLSAKGEIRVNLRSQGKVDVNKIAQAFGGGGHKTASGATVSGKIDVVRKKVLVKIKGNL